MRKNTIAVALLSIFLASFLLLSTKVSADADEIIDRIELSVPVACTMGGTGTTSHNATIDPGTYSGASGSDYENGIGKTVLTSFCNDANGFAIYAIGYTGDSYDSENHTKLVGVNTNQTIATKVYASGDTSSNWSMKLTKVTDSTESYLPANMSILGSFDNWHAVPASYTKVAEYHSSTTDPSTTDTILGAKLETTYATYISTTQVADTYNGQVKYTMVHPYNEEPAQPQASNSGKICYYKNTATADGTMGCQDIASSVTLLASNFSRAGYGFAGWSDKFDYATNSEAKFYGPQETISIPDVSVYTGEGKGLSLYAVWVKSEGSLQDTSKVAQLCSAGADSLTVAPTDGTADLTSVSALTDQRDNQTYAIAKLADGKCWMIENLRLDDSAILTLANTNNPLNNGTNVTLKHNYTDTATSSTLSPTSSVAYNASTAPDGWCTENSASCDDQSRLRTDNTVNRATNSPNTNSGSMYSYGNYYNWYSATAGNGTYSFSTNNNSVTGDICPSGWHLPIGGRKANVGISEFWKLPRAIIGADPANFANDNFYYTGTPEGTDASNKMRAYPTNYLYSGYIVGGSLDNRGAYGIYWSSTAFSADNAYYFRLDSANVNPGTLSYNKYGGRTVRCIANSL